MPERFSGSEASRNLLAGMIDKAAELLPVSGPITAFAFLNMLQALEDMPFDAGLRRGAQLYGCQPYLSESAYRKRMAQGRIHSEDLQAVLIDDLGDLADALLPSLLGTRHGLRQALLRYPMRGGPTTELRWFIVETDALTKIRSDAPAPARAALVEDTRHWVMRDVRAGLHRRGADSPASKKERRDVHLLADLLNRYDVEAIEGWTEETWEAVTLHALWRVCREGVHGIESFEPAPVPMIRHRDLLLAATHIDCDALVHEVLVRFCASFTDQGFAHWQLPNRDQGFWRAFVELFRESTPWTERWMSQLPAELARVTEARLRPLDVVAECLDELGVRESEQEDFITAELLALRGWAGMLRHMEVRGDRVPRGVPTGTIVEFLAVRLLLSRLAFRYVARERLAYTESLAGLRDFARSRVPHAPAATIEQRAFLIFQLSQVLGWSPPALFHLSKHQWAVLLREVETFSDVERRRMFHLAFERRFRVQALDALSVHATQPAQRVANPRFQAVFCIDAREESFRRHLEETAPDTETFGAAGFFGVAMYYRGVAAANFEALCPIVIKPQHWLVEDDVYTFEADGRRRAKTRRALGAASLQIHHGSRNIAKGALLTATVGVLASIPLIGRVLFPGLTARLRQSAGRFVEPPPVTRLRLERESPQPGPEDHQIGFSVEEMANVGERQLRDIGLTTNFSRLVIIFGHGSACLNNPHKSAYDCGACSGNPGAPNARALAAFLNDVRVREILLRRGLEIPSTTRFIGALHNTGKDALTFFDLDLLPKSHLTDFEGAKNTLYEACRRNAHERCRRFQSARLDLTLDEAHRHVEERCEDLSQPRPEFGNATNAMCFVGRRSRVRGLFLDRRSFLTGYDPTHDDAEHTILARILAAAVPVCEGINMTYFLSYIDSPGWACGTKLPHNVTSLLAVMDGAASDLRPGLPWQSVEIHEPMRLLFVVETSPAAMLSIMARNPVVGRILRNGWAQLAVLDPESSAIQVFEQGEFRAYRPEVDQLPRADSSADWYRGWRDHLAFAQIKPA